MSDSEPEITVLCAEPDSQESNDSSESMEMNVPEPLKRKSTTQRFNSVNLSKQSPIQLPSGMKPINLNPFIQHSVPVETEENNNSALGKTEIFLLAAGIGLGVLLVYKGYSYVKPLFSSVKETVEEVVTQAPFEVDDIVENMN